MAKWTGNCGYCATPGAGNLDRYECPRCQRSGCPTCMPEAGVTPCNFCQDEDRKKNDGFGPG